MPETITNLGEGYALCDVAAVVLRVSETLSYLIKTGTEINCKPAVSSGTEKELRKGNTIHGLYKSQDVAKGTDLELTDVLMHMEIYALIDGGTVTKTTEGVFKGYEAPVAGAPVVRSEFEVDVYCGDADNSGNYKGYVKMTYANCKGKPCEPNIKDGDFYSPKYSIESRPAKGKGMYDISYVDSLPEAS